MTVKHGDVVQMGTTIVLTGIDVKQRKFTSLPNGVVKWRIRCRAPIGRTPALLYLHYQDGRTEEWIMQAIGRRRMKPVICQGVNMKGNA